MKLINLVGLAITACICIAVIVIIVGIILDFLGFYDRIGKMEHHLDNDEFDYGHDVKHKLEE